MEHLPFGKMCETTQQWYTQKHPAFKKPRMKAKDAQSLLASAQLRSDRSIWVASEKIDGSNFSFVVTQSSPSSSSSPLSVRCAKRETMLDDSSDADNATFFGYRRVKARHDEHAAAVFQQVARTIFAEDGTLQISSTLAQQVTMTCPDFDESLSAGTTQLVRVTIYGELFGGGFPGVAPPASGAVSLVQDGIYYSPDLAFSAFDLAITLSQQHQHQQQEFTIPCDFLPAMQLLSKCGFLTAQPLAICGFDEATNLSIDFTSTIPALLGVPREAISKIAATNKAEGIVCRTNIAQVVPLLNNKKRDRCMFKRKQAKFHAVREAAAAAVSAQQGDAPPEGGAGAARALLDTIRDQLLTTDDLIRSAISKTGRPTGATAAKITKRICELVFEDIADEIEQQEEAPSHQQQQHRGGKKSGANKAASAAAASAAPPDADVSAKMLLKVYQEEVQQLVKDAVEKFLK